MKWNAYHFVGETLRDGSPVPADGVTLKHDGPLVLCESGFHASRTAFQALKYAPGTTLCRVHSSGEVIEPDGEGKLVSRERTIITRIDAESLLREFARLCALGVIHLWNAPDVVREYLETGREEIRDASWAASWDSVRAASWGLARAAAQAAAWDSARDAAQDAVRDSVRAASWAAARDDAAWDAALDAARDAAWDAQAVRFNNMVNAAFGNDK